MTALNEMTREQLIAHIAGLSAKPAAKLSLKVSAKGALSVYGMGRWPVTLYRTQWEKLLAPDSIDAINAFMVANASLLSVKPEA